jgi:hypothetical protein
VTHVADQEQVSNQLNTQFDSRKDKAVETMAPSRMQSEAPAKLKGVGLLGAAARSSDGTENVLPPSSEREEDRRPCAGRSERFARREPAFPKRDVRSVSSEGGSGIRATWRGKGSEGSSYTGGSDRQAIDYDREGVYALVRQRVR